MRPLLPAVCATALLFAAPALAATDVACWNRDVERMDHYSSPPEKGDNQFFTAVSARSETTNVTLLYPAKASMKELTHSLYDIRVRGTVTGTGMIPGCNYEYMEGLRYFMPTDVPAPAGLAGLQGKYNPLLTYPDPRDYSGMDKKGNLDGSDGQADGLSTTATSAYRYLQWPAPGKTTPSAETTVTACKTVTGLPETDAKYIQCKTCVETKGYYLRPDAPLNDVSANAAVFSGKFLRFHPPKATLLSLAYKRLVKGPLLSVLREAVVAQNDGTGGKVVQKMLPQSCSGQGRPMNQKLAAIDGLSYTTNANPLAEMLFNTGWYMDGQPSSWHSMSASTKPGSVMADGKSEPCDNCAGDFMVLFSDGRGDEGNDACRKIDGVLPAFCTVEAKCDTVGLGSEGDGNEFLDPSWAPNVTGSSVLQTPGLTCEKDYADDVARWLYTGHTSGTRTRRITTYVVGVGDANPAYGRMETLKQVAQAGGTTAIFADNFKDLEQAIDNVITKIITNATSFSASAITSVQTRGYTSAFIPRFRPGDGAQWSGTLARFHLYNEFADGCTETDWDVKKDPNPNGNKSCTDVYLRDKNQNFVGEDGEGNFVLLDENGDWDGGFPIKKGADGKTIPAAPVWEAADKLTARAQALIAAATSGTTATVAERAIYTVKPNGSGGYDPTPIRFSVSNVANITPLLKLGGVNGPLCTTLEAYTRSVYANEDECATDVIRFMHGEDVLRQHPDNRKTPQPNPLKPRPKILGDIFHSTPVLVTPPAPTFLCDLGVANQCVASLYEPGLGSEGRDAYATYATTHQHRTQFVLVGANDGMLHAFNAGNYQPGASGAVGTYDLGTGEELWAFIPPDILPKLIRYMIGERHELLVDGTPMVRDVWADGSGSVTTKDGKKQAGEYHTVAVVGEREGGRSYFALDVTNASTPKFLWSWPPPGTTEALNAGESWNDIGPAAPPIGPIAEADENGPFKVGATQARERYIVAVGGGYDPAYLRGRAIHVLDVWTGEQVYRFSQEDASGTDDPRNHLLPVAAPVTLVDTNQDALFDTAVVGDLGGQMWTLNMMSAGEDTSGDKRYDNWYGARSFVQFKAGKFAQRSPFFQRAATARMPSSETRVYVGAGDRDHIKDPNGGLCSVGNLSACMRKGCTVSVSSSRYRIGNAPSGVTDGYHAKATFSHTANATVPTTTLDLDEGGNVECDDAVDVNIDYSISCTGATAVSVAAPVFCDWNTASGGLECPEETGRPLSTTIVPTNNTVEKSRFYSFKLFDLTGTRDRFGSWDEAEDYDALALTDSDLDDADTEALEGKGVGWRVTHDRSMNERTASSAVVLGGCVAWNTLKPNETSEVACGESIPADTAYMYQADAITGAVTETCGERYVARDTYTPPQPPVIVIGVNPKTGEIHYGLVDIPPGAPPKSVTVGKGEIMGPIHWLEVPREVHDCRHMGTCS